MIGLLAGPWSFVRRAAYRKPIGALYPGGGSLVWGEAMQGPCSAFVRRAAFQAPAKDDTVNKAGDVQ